MTKLSWRKPAESFFYNRRAALVDRRPAILNHEWTRMSTKENDIMMGVDLATGESQTVEAIFQVDDDVQQVNVRRRKSEVVVWTGLNSCVILNAL